MVGGFAEFCLLSKPLRLLLRWRVSQKPMIANALPGKKGQFLSHYTSKLVNRFFFKKKKYFPSFVSFQVKKYCS